ncbi:MAG TPA: sporulation YhaL family protein [Candidatus Avamphibacillus sp.]|nr:sporulation YhaL family protein [Candidatus Avamphibacillus sp.]
MILGVPWWVFITILLIFLSGFMAFRAIRAEQKLEQKFIEEEGNKYMERIEIERKNREEKKRQHT